MSTSNRYNFVNSAPI